MNTAEGWLAGSYHMKVINPAVCVVCRGPITSTPAYALGAPYNCLIHDACLPYFNYTGRYPHPLPAIFYETPRPPLRRSQDDNGFVSIRHSPTQ